MDFSIALPIFLITFRECVEAVLIIGIVLALLNKAGKSQLNSWVYTGIGIGIVISVFICLLYTSQSPLDGLLSSMQSYA